MTHKEILAKAIEKAVKNGWTPPFEEPITNVPISQDDVEGTPQLDPYIKIEFDNDTSDYLVGIPGLLFNHDFAKALWGEKWIKSIGPGVLQYKSNKGWQYHLQQMVIADNPIAYLGGNLPA